MAVKARENLIFEGISMWVTGILFAVVFGFLFFYTSQMVYWENQELVSMIGSVAVVILTILLVFSFRFMSTHFFLVLSNRYLNINRQILFFKKEIANIPVGTFKKMIPIEEKTNVNGKTVKCTLLRSKTKKTYALYYQEGTVENCLEIQCSDKFHRQLKNLIKDQ